MIWLLVTPKHKVPTYYENTHPLMCNGADDVHFLVLVCSSPLLHQNYLSKLHTKDQSWRVTSAMSWEINDWWFLCKNNNGVMKICQLTQSKVLWDWQCRRGGAFAAGNATDLSILVDKQNILCRTLAGHFQWCSCGGDRVRELLWCQWPSFGTSQNSPRLQTWRVINACCEN